MSIDSWLGSTFPLPNWTIGEIPGDAARLINEKPTQVAIRRGSTTLSAQRFRLEAMTYPGQQVGPTAITTGLSYVVIGFKGQPGETDADIKRGDRFYVDELQTTFLITDLIPGLRYSIQAVAQAQQGTK